ncbi:hypothetical protein [Lactococcus allomyrinae]|nr:hypothetical protein [Lactococcus allomyrinae]
MNYNYHIYRPSGNDTALVEGNDFSEKERQEINRVIMSQHPNVEQVGFITARQPPKLSMAGGEFCGNASRCAAFYYLGGADGVLALEVCEGKRKVNVGMEKGQAWSEIPLIDSIERSVKKLTDDLYEVKLEGITHLVSIGYPQNPKHMAMKFIDKYKETVEDCLGVIFVEDDEIYPVVWVKKINTLFCETACGSGTMAVAMVEYKKFGNFVELGLRQPSGKWITAIIDKRGARIFGEVEEIPL